MSDETKIDPQHSSTRQLLRTLGPTVVGIGLLLIIVGMVDFFSVFGSMESPHLFWCVFLGMPVLFVGVVMCQFAFFGAVARYISGEAAPVQKDTFNYLADGTKEGVKTVAQAIGEGLSAAHAGVHCGQCNHSNDADARFCKNCGAPLVRQV